MQEPRPGRLKRLQEKLDSPGIILTFVACLGYLAYRFGGEIGVGVVGAIVLVAAVAIGILYALTWMFFRLMGRL